MNPNNATLSDNTDALTDTELTPLGSLIEPLEDLEYIATLHRVESDGLIETLHVLLDGAPDRTGLLFNLEICIMNDLMQAFGDEDEADEAIITQFMLVLPFSFTPESYLEVMRLCNIINRLLPVGAFGLSENDGAVYLRYCLTSASRYIDDVVIAETVQALEFACREYGPHFEKASQGEAAASDFLRKFAESGHTLPSVGDPSLLRG